MLLSVARTGQQLIRLVLGPAAIFLPASATRSRRHGSDPIYATVLVWGSKLVLARLHKKIGEADFFLRKMREQEPRIIGERSDVSS